MRKLVRWTLFAFGGAVLAGVAMIVSLARPYRGFQGDTFVRIERGAGAAGISKALAQAGVIRYSWQLWVGRAVKPSARLQAGEYRFSQPASTLEVIDRLRRGDVYYFEFTVPEGHNMFDIARAIEASGTIHGADFLGAASNPKSILDLAPRASSLEGYLFPSTYRLSHSTTAAELCRLMTDQFRRHWKKLSPDGAADVHRTVTLASMVEKETGAPDERPLIAGVFMNRLTKGMRLDCDPTTIYAALLENRYRGVIHRSDLDSRNPYNTYQNDGLPPGPIANPGAAALAAALHPAETDYIYFVAKHGGGRHQFSASLKEHQQAVQEFLHGSPKKLSAAKRPRKAS